MPSPSSSARGKDGGPAEIKISVHAASLPTKVVALAVAYKS
jgi:hypothetical protein